MCELKIVGNRINLKNTMTSLFIYNSKRKDLEKEMTRRQEALLEEARKRREKNKEDEEAQRSSQERKRRQSDPYENPSSESSNRSR